MKARTSLCSPQPGEGFVSSQNSSLCSKQQGFTSQSREVWLSQASRGGLLSQAVLPWKEASSGRQLPGMLPGWMWGRKLCYLLALTTLQLSSASKGNPAAAARPPTHCPQSGKGTFQEVYGSGLLSSLHSPSPQDKVSMLTSNPGRNHGHGLVMEHSTKAALILMVGSLWSWTFGYSSLICQLQILLHAFPSPPLPSGKDLLKHSKRKAKDMKLDLNSLF